MSKGATLEEVTSYLEQMASGLSGDRGQTQADLYRLLGMIRGDIPLCGPGVQPREPAVSRNVQMTPTAATPKTTKAKGKGKSKSKAKAEGAEAVDPGED